MITRARRENMRQDTSTRPCFVRFFRFPAAPDPSPLGLLEQRRPVRRSLKRSVLSKADVQVAFFPTLVFRDFHIHPLAGNAPRRARFVQGNTICNPRYYPAMIFNYHMQAIVISRAFYLSSSLFAIR